MIDPFTRIFKIIWKNEFRDFDTQAEVAPVGPGTGENRVLHVCLVLCVKHQPLICVHTGCEASKIVSSVSRSCETGSEESDAM